MEVNNNYRDRQIREKRFSPHICLTHNCNLNCIYCYQKHNSNDRMSLDTAKKCIDWIFSNVPDSFDGVEIDFIGGEPLLEFDLIKDIVNYTYSEKRSKPFIFFATTNGTVLTDEMKEWFIERKQFFTLGLSLDGQKKTHNYNRCNSFDKIDIEFFKKNWPYQGVKMTLSEYSLQRLAEDIKYLHSLDLGKIAGTNLAEGDFDWDKNEYIKMLIPQFIELVNFYVENDEIEPCQMLDKYIGACEAKNETKKWCGIGTGIPFFDIDGKMYPCPFITPMTFSKTELENILLLDYSNEDNFFDEKCFKECYIYPICPTCSGANYMVNRTFKKRNRSKCRVQKLIALFIADLQAKRIQKNPEKYNNENLFFTIEAIKKIRELYLKEFCDII